MSDAVPIGPGPDNYGEGWCGGETVDEIAARLIREQEGDKRMSDDDIMSVLGEFINYDGLKDDGFSDSNPRRMLESHNALQPVLAKLSEKQWENMLSFIFSGAWTHRSEAQKQRYLLTCPLRVLAESVAAVVKEAR